MRNRKPVKQLIIKITNANKDVIQEKHLYDLPVREEIVIMKSVEFFNDPEPCYIHRGAVLNRLYHEIERRLESGPLSSDDEIIRVLSLPPQAAYIFLA